MPVVHCNLGAGPWYLFPRVVSIYRANDLDATIPRRTYFRHIEAIFSTSVKMLRVMSHDQPTIVRS